jgi:hypothetical protein
VKVNIEAKGTDKGSIIPIVMTVVGDTIKDMRTASTVDSFLDIDELVIPSSYILRGKEVKIRKISSSIFDVESFNQRKSYKIATPSHEINKLIISEGIEEVEVAAFKLAEIKEVIWPSTCKTISEMCFYRSNLVSLKNIDSVENVEASAFVGCSNLIEFDWPKSCDSIPSDCFFECYYLKEIRNIENVKSIGDSAFFGCTRLNSFNWPSKVLTIPKDCFAHCSSLEEINGIKNVTEIGDSAFDRCLFSTFHWPSKCKVIPNRCFKDNPLKSIDGIENVTKIGEAAFYHSKFTSFDWPKGCYEIASECFAYSDIAEINGVEDVQVIGSGAFAYSKIEKFIWPDNCPDVPLYCFQCCHKLKEITLNSSVTSISRGAFFEAHIFKLDLSELVTCKIDETVIQDIPEIIYPFYI